MTIVVINKKTFVTYMTNESKIVYKILYKWIWATQMHSNILSNLDQKDGSEGQTFGTSLQTPYCGQNYE